MTHSEFWHDIKDSEAHEAMIGTIRAIRQERSYYYDTLKAYAAYYQDRGRPQGFEPGQWRRATDDIGHDRVVSYNVIRSCVATIVSKIGAHEPDAQYLTSDGDQVVQQKARDLEAFDDGAYRNAGGYRKSRKVLRDAALYGMGFLKVYPGDDGVKMQWVHPSRITVDEQACLDCEPRQLYQTQHMSRSVLCALFPKKKKEIHEARSNYNGIGISRDLVEVHEGWHIGAGGNDGKHVICIEGATLFSEPWKDPTPPFAVLRWDDDLVGWSGTGLADELEGIQLEINELVTKIQKNMALLAVPFILQPTGSDIKDSDLESNEDARIISFTGQAPQVITPPAMHPQVFQHLETLYRRAFELAGISMLSAASQKPAGIESGIAIQSVQDIETQRFSDLSHKWAEFRIDVSKLMIRAARRVSNKKFAVNARDKDDLLRRIKYSDVALDDSQFDIGVYPTSALPNTPAGRISLIKALGDAGMALDPREAREKFGFLDHKKGENLFAAERRMFERIFEGFLRGEEYQSPNDIHDIALGAALASQFRAKGFNDGADQLALDKLEMWAVEARKMLQPPPPPVEPPGPEMPPEMMGAPPMMPGGPDMPMPQGELPPPPPEALMPSGAM